MQKRKSFVPYFLVFLIISLTLIMLSKGGFLRPVDSFFQAILAPFQGVTHSVFSKITNLGETKELKRLKEENSSLVKKLVDQEKLIADNKALRDQFQTQSIRSSNLLSASVLGAPGFIPSVSVPEAIILDKGEKDGVIVGNAVVFNDNLIGKVTKTSLFQSRVILITNSTFSFTAKTLNTKSLGVVKGQGGGEMILDNVLLSDSLQKDDMVLTKGDINEKNEGFIPDLVVGKITSVSKNPSDLFQKAEVKSQVDFIHLDRVFIITSFN